MANTDIERALLGAFFDGAAIPAGITDDHFQEAHGRLAFAALKQMIGEGLDIAEASLYRYAKDRLKKDMGVKEADAFKAYVSEIARGAFYAPNAQFSPTP